MSAKVKLRGSVEGRRRAIIKGPKNTTYEVNKATYTKVPDEAAKRLGAGTYDVIFDKPQVSSDEETPVIESVFKYTKESLEELSFSELRKLGKNFDPPIVDRSKTRIIKEILGAQQ